MESKLGTIFVIDHLIMLNCYRQTKKEKTKKKYIKNPIINIFSIYSKYIKY